MKEVLVAELDKQDLARYKELEQGEKKLRLLMAEHHSRYEAFWEGLKVKHNLAPGGHYIKGGAIYKQEL